MIRTAKKLTYVILLGLIFVASPALAAVEVVTPSEPHGWFYKQGNENATGSIVNVADNHSGSGSFEFRLTDQTTGNGSMFQIAKIPVITVDDVEELDWDFRSDATNGQYPVVKLEYYSLNPHRSGTLVYRYSGTVSNGTWQHVDVDLNTDLWWDTDSGDTKTLAEWQQDLSGILVNYFVAGLGTTSGNTVASTSHIDYIHLKATRRNIDTTWDFEGVGDVPAPPPAPQLVTVLPTDAKGWFEKQGTGGGATMELSTDQPFGPGNTGSLRFIKPDAAGAIIQAARIPVIRASDLREVGWVFYSDSATSFPVVKIEYYGQGRSGTLVYDRDNIASYTPNTWQDVQVDFNSDLWWSTEFGSGDKRTLTQWQQNLGNIAINYYVVGIGSTGPASAAVTSYADLVHLATSSTNTYWDFEATGDDPLPPIPTLNEWGIIILSLMLTGIAVVWIRKNQAERV
jgi:hypothetical protein